MRGPSSTSLSNGRTRRCGCWRGTRYGIGESVSTDRGVTWPELQPSSIAHPSARFFVRRLRSGRLLLLKRGTLDKAIGRAQLIAFVSKDDGRT